MIISRNKLKKLIEVYLFEQDIEPETETNTEEEIPAEEAQAETQEEDQSDETIPDELDAFTIEVEGQKKSVQFRKVTALNEKQGEKKEKLVPFIDGKPFKPRGGNPTVLDTIVLAAYGLLDSLSEETRDILEKIVTKQAISGFFKGSSGGALVSKIERVIKAGRPGSGFEPGYLAKRLGLR